MRFLLSLTLLASLLFAGEAEDLKKKLDALDKAIAAQKEADKTALGSARLEKLRDARDKVAVEYRRLTKKKVAAKTSIGKDGVYEVDKLIARGQTGDIAALTALRNLKLKIDAALAPNARQNGGVIGFRQNVIVLGGGAFQGGIQRFRIGGLQVLPVAEGEATTKKLVAKPTPKSAEAPAALKQQLTEMELAEQDERALALEKQLVQMTRQVLELERRLKVLRAKVAEADKR